jgi:hypothetical protein
MRQLHNITRLITLTGVCLGISGHAAIGASQPEGVRPMPVDRDAGVPDSGERAQQLFGQRQVFDLAAPMPMHPPIDQIPPMPMPDFGDRDQPRTTLPSNSMTVHNAETGETFEIDPDAPSGRIGGQSIEGEYRGAAPYDNMDELSRTFGNMVAAGGLDSWPRSGNVKLVMRFTDVNNNFRWFVCSGTMSDAGTVLTAAHCVYNRASDIDDWADIIYIYPGWDGNGGIVPPAGDAVFENFGYAYGSFYIAGSGYVNSGDWDRDCAVIRISRGGSRNVGMLTGWYGWAWGGSCGTIQGRTYNNFSYPAENCPTPGLHNGQTMYYWSGGVDGCPNNQMQLNTGGNCLDTVWGGMSGSGMYYIDGDNRYVHSICSTSNRNDRGYYCQLWEQFVLDMNDFENDTRTNFEDWEPLMFRARGSTTVQAGTSMNDSCDVRMINATNANPPTRDYQLKVYLSTNNNISEADTLLATWNWNARDFGAMANVNFVVPAPFIPIDTPPGNYWIGVIADAGLPGTDSNDDTDTWDAQPITVTVGLPAAASSPVPAHNSINQSIFSNLDWATAARATSYRVYFGTTNPPPFIGSTSGSSWNLPNLAYDTQYTWRVDTVNSAGTTTGSTWTFRTEPPPAPDLTAEVANAPTGPVYRGTNINVFHRTRNNGNLATSGTTVDFRISTNNFISVADPLMGTSNFGGLAPGAILQTNTSVQIPPTLAPGDYYVGIIVSEPSNSDSNTFDNWVADVDTITVRACAADFAPPWGVTNFFDVAAYIALYNAGDPRADVAAPFGTLNFFDISFYITLYNRGCP